MPAKEKMDWIPWILFILLALIWGSSFILMKRGLEAFSFQQVAAIRLSLAFICLIPVGAKYLKNIPTKKLVPIILVGLFGNGFPAFLFTLAETEVSSSIVGILNATVPIFTLILGLAFFGGKVRLVQIVGVSIGLFGAAWLIFPNGFVLNGRVNYSYASLVVIATLCYAISANTIKQYLQDLKSVQITFLALGFAGIPATIYLFTTDFISVLTTHPLGYSSFGYTFILAFIGTSIGVVLFNELIKRSNAIFASSVTYLIPVVAIIWGVLDGEELLTLQFFAVIVIVLGVYLVNKRQTKSKNNNKNVVRL
ncbi:MAG: drug/metabolite transporter (DMT)-like permease [Candidatus Azotimanducaceae bacterium]|jgi:drug/metabolite transporter (DMT)-like permease